MANDLMRKVEKVGNVQEQFKGKAGAKKTFGYIFVNFLSRLSKIYVCKKYDPI